MANIDEIICSNCWDVLAGPNKTKGAEYYEIAWKIYCSIHCYQEERKEKEEQQARKELNKSSKRSNKTRSGKNKTKRNKKKDK